MGSSCSNLNFEQFPTDLLTHTLSFGSYKELCKHSTIAKLLYELITTSDKLWRDLCLIEWKNKAYIPSKYHELISSKREDINIDEKQQDTIIECNCRKAYRLAYLDRMRTVITMKEVCDIKWYFHFKGSIDNDWENAPNDMTRMIFDKNGIVNIIPNAFTKNSFVGQDYIWKFDGSYCKKNEYGNAIQINSYPKERITRNKNWGFVVQNPYVIYACFPIPEPQTDEYKSMVINYWVPIECKYPFGQAEYVKVNENELEKKKQNNEKNDSEVVRANHYHMMSLFMNLLNNDET
eukprot:492307_1